MADTTSIQPVLAGKTAFVQGGSRGIGAAIAQRLAAAGANVALSYVQSQARAQAVVTVWPPGTPFHVAQSFPIPRQHSPASAGSSFEQRPESESAETGPRARIAPGS